MAGKFNSRSSIILGMHDALVSLLGMIAGFYFAFADTDLIIISCIIASITASLSMAAANYLAVKSVNRKIALKSALYTGISYIITCTLLILPFFVFPNRLVALISVFAIAILVIFLFNRSFYRGKRFYKHFFEMLSICAIISLIAFLIGEAANKIFGI